MEYIPRTAKVEAYYNRPDISFKKDLRLITVEGSNLEVAILFNPLIAGVALV